MTPSRKDLKILSDIAAGPVEEGKQVSYKCEVSRVKPLPRALYFKFTDSDRTLATTVKNEVNTDGLTYKVSAEFAMTASRTYQGKKLQCVFVTSNNQTITSTEERQMQIICK